MAVYNVDPLANDNIPEHGKEGEDGREGRLAIDNKEWYIIDLKSIGEIAYTRSSSVGMSDHNDFVAAIDEFLGVSVGLDKMVS